MLVMSLGRIAHCCFICRLYNFAQSWWWVGSVHGVYGQAPSCCAVSDGQQPKQLAALACRKSHVFGLDVRCTAFLPTSRFFAINN